MTTNIINGVPYLRTSRSFPPEINTLAIQVNKSYIDIANNVNAKIIGIFPTRVAAITGEQWFLTQNQRQQSLRQVFTFTATTPITHNIELNTITDFTRCWGEYTDGTNEYGLFWATSIAIAGQITFYLTPTQIIFVVDGAAPALNSGRIILEWLSAT